MASFNVTKDNISQAINEGGILLLDFWASWCGPCRIFGPIFEKASESHPDIHFGKIDTEKEVELASALQVKSIPMLMAFRDGILLYAQPGALPESALEELISRIKQLNMDQVRQELDELTDEEPKQGAAS